MQDLLVEYMSTSATALALVKITSEGSAITWANTTFGDIFGLLPEEATGSLLESFFINKIEFDSLRKISSTNIVVSLFDEQHIVSVSSNPLCEPFWMIEISEKQAVSKGTKGAEEKLVALADVAPTGIFYSGVGLRLDYVNHQFVSIFGQGAPSLLGIGWLNHIDQNDRERLTDLVVSVINSNDPSYKASFRTSATKQGARKELLFHFRHVVNEDKSNGFVGTIEDITDRVHHEKQLHDLANHDVLTGALNRQAFTMEANNFNRLYQAQGIQDLLLLFMDLDKFKQVNDTYGHHAGDCLLTGIVKRMSDAFGSNGHVYRFAGDEFVCLLPIQHGQQTNIDEAIACVESCFEEEFDLGDNTWIKAGGSVGASLLSESKNIEDLVRGADQAMYQNKKYNKICA